MDGEYYAKYLCNQPELIEFHEGYRRYRDDYKRAPEAYRVLFCGYWCQYEINNGGFKQFFWNSTGVIAPEAVLAFQTVGLPELAAVVRDAMIIFGSAFPRNRQTRIKFIDERYPKGIKIPEGEGSFDLFDSRFYDLEQTKAGNWDKAADAYLRKHLRKQPKKSVAPKRGRTSRKSS